MRKIWHDIVVSERASSSAEVNIYIYIYIYIYMLAATLKVKGSHTSLGDISEIEFL